MQGERMRVHLDQIRAAAVQDPGDVRSYAVDATEWALSGTPATFLRVLRWAEILSGPSEALDDLRSFALRVRNGWAARRKGLTFPDKAVDVDLDGVRLKFGLEMWVSGDFFLRVMKRGQDGRYLIHEPGVQRALKRLAGPDTLVVDVGAHVGYFSCYAAALGATVLAVEMQPTLCDAIAMNAAMNNLWRVHTVCTALSGEAGIAQLWRFEPRPGTKIHSQRLDPGWGWHPVRSLNHDLVTVSTVDQLLSFPQEAAPRSTIVKIDAEGAEGMVLSGAHRTLAERRASFIVECHILTMSMFGTTLSEILDAFPEDGWSCTMLEEETDREVDRATVLDIAANRPPDADSLPGSLLFTPRD